MPSAYLTIVTQATVDLGWPAQRQFVMQVPFPGVVDGQAVLVTRDAGPDGEAEMDPILVSAQGAGVDVARVSICALDGAIGGPIKLTLAAFV